MGEIKSLLVRSFVRMNEYGTSSLFMLHLKETATKPFHPPKNPAAQYSHTSNKVYHVMNYTKTLMVQELICLNKMRRPPKRKLHSFIRS